MKTIRQLSTKKVRTIEALLFNTPLYAWKENIFEIHQIYSFTYVLFIIG